MGYYTGTSFPFLFGYLLLSLPMKIPKSTQIEMRRVNRSFLISTGVQCDYSKRNINNSILNKPLFIILFIAEYLDRVISLNVHPIVPKTYV